MPAYLWSTARVLHVVEAHGLRTFRHVLAEFPAGCVRGAQAVEPRSVTVATLTDITINILICFMSDVVHRGRSCRLVPRAASCT